MVEFKVGLNQNENRTPQKNHLFQCNKQFCLTKNNLFSLLSSRPGRPPKRGVPFPSMSPQVRRDSLSYKLLVTISHVWLSSPRMCPWCRTRWCTWRTRCTTGVLPPPLRQPQPLPVLISTKTWRTVKVRFAFCSRLCGLENNELFISLRLSTNWIEARFILYSKLFLCGFFSLLNSE